MVELVLSNTHSLTHLRGDACIYTLLLYWCRNNQEVELGWGMCIYHQRFNNIMAVSIIGGRNRNAWRKHQSVTKH